jgi:predicted dehydrogenase
MATAHVAPSSVLGANEQIHTGHIGVNNRGKDHVKRLASNAVALCDVDQHVLAREQKVVAAAGGKCEMYNDYRRLLEREDVDAVVIATPDQWHALIAVAACNAGKDIYCEKPLSLTIVEGRAMVAAARKNNVVFQTGSQQRSDQRFRRACEAVRSGAAGKLSKIEVGLPGPSQRQPLGPDQDQPDWLDYDFWLGPAPLRHYNPDIVHMPHRAWRWQWDYSGGQMTNWGAHHLDIAQWGMGTDDTGPVEIAGTAQYHPQNWFPTPVEFHVTYRYANGITVVAGQKYEMGVTFRGTDGSIYVTRGKISSDPPELLAESNNSVRLYASDDHMGDWLDCIRSRKRPVCDVETGHRSVTVAHLGNITIRTRRTIRWDPDQETIVGDDEASRMLARPYRRPWRL